MNFALTEAQEMLKKQAREFVEKECPKTLVREMEEDERGYPPELWHKIAGLGWLGLPFPEEYEGLGLGFLDLTVLLEEIGRALLPGPFISTVVLGGLTILDSGSEVQKKEFLTKIARGEINLTMALTEASARYDAGINMQAIPRGNSYVLDGVKLFVPDAVAADWLLCVARTRDGRKKDEGITLFVVDKKRPGITVTPLKTIAGDKQGEIAFKAVEVPRDNIIGGVDQGWGIVAKTLEKAAVAECAVMVGGAQYVLDTTVEYAKTRVQFERPIGSFQAIQHKCADMVTWVDGMRFITYQAAWKLEEGHPATMEVSLAKAWGSQAYRRVCAEGLHLHGAIALTKDHDLELYFRRQKSAELAFGDAGFHRGIVAQEMGL